VAAKFDTATIAERIDLTAELAVFRIAPASKLDFLPGQFASLGVEEDGRILQRPYSMASAAHEPLLEFFLELVPGGRLTPRLWELRAGDRLLVGETAAGTFYLDRKTGMTAHLMLCTVTGIAPFVSMIRTHQYELERGLHAGLRFAMIHGASYVREIDYYREEMTMIARQGWFDYVPTISRPAEDPDWRGETGRIEDVMRKHADALGFDHTRAIAYACGHPTMVENARAILQRARFPKVQIHTEKYFTIKLPR
jgi:ferredoxin/flavodoxin---NADP+ reductase